MLYCVLPAIEDLQTAWEGLATKAKYHIYHDAINDSLEKLKKYYSKFNEKPTYVLALGTSNTHWVLGPVYDFFTALHPYYKLNYIEMAWGGLEEQEAEIAAGNPDAKNWQDEAWKIIEKQVCMLFLSQWRNI